jgi:PHB/PHA accumulation regulator DNA-binding domain
MKNPEVLVRKYADRRVYDSSIRRYVKLDDIAHGVRDTTFHCVRTLLANHSLPTAPQNSAVEQLRGRVEESQRRIAQRKKRGRCTFKGKRRA